MDIIVMRMDGKIVRHLANSLMCGGEITACGVAFEGYTGNVHKDEAREMEFVSFSKHGKINCKGCISMIEFFKAIPKSKYN